MMRVHLRLRKRDDRPSVQSGESALLMAEYSNQATTVLPGKRILVGFDPIRGCQR